VYAPDESGAEHRCFESLHDVLSNELND